jgi:hypothetical protein
LPAGEPILLLRVLPAGEPILLLRVLPAGEPTEAIVGKRAQNSSPEPMISGGIYQRSPSL